MDGSNAIASCPGAGVVFPRPPLPTDGLPLRMTTPITGLVSLLLTHFLWLTSFSTHFLCFLICASGNHIVEKLTPPNSLPQGLLPGQTQTKTVTVKARSASNKLAKHLTTHAQKRFTTNSSSSTLVLQLDLVFCRRKKMLAAALRLVGVQGILAAQGSRTSKLEP